MMRAVGGYANGRDAAKRAIGRGQLQPAAEFNGAEACATRLAEVKGLDRTRVDLERRRLCAGGTAENDRGE